MADRYWVGANGTSGAATAYATTASWSASKNGASGASIPDPAASDIVRFDTATTGAKFVNVNQSIGNIPNIYFVNSGGNWALAGSSSTAAGTAWTLTAPVTIDVGPTPAADAQFNNNISASGSAKIIKTGQGSFSNYTVTSTTWGTCPIDLQEGTILFGAVNDKLGTGKITMFGGTYIAEAQNVARTLNNPIDVRGNVGWNYEPSFPSVSRGQVTLKAAVDFGSSNYTVNVGGTTSNSVIVSGAITGTAGFTKAGTGTLTLSNAGNNFGTGQTITINAGDLLGNNTFDSFGSATINLVNSGSRSYFVGSATTATSPNAYSGAGALAMGYYAAASFAAGQLAGLTGTTPPPNGTNVIAGALSGLTLYANRSTPTQVNCIANVNDLPTTVVFTGDSNAAAGITTAVNFNGQVSGNNYSGTTFYLHSTTNSANPWTNRISANQAVGGGLTIGNVTRSNTSSNTLTMTLTLDGTSTGVDNIVAGTMSQLAGCGTLAVTKSGVTKWILSGQNTYTGTTSITAGTLSAQGVAGTRTPLGGSGAVTVTAVTGSGTLDISSTDTSASSVMSVNKAGTALSLGGTGTYQLTSTTGFNEYVCAGVTLNTTLPVNVAAGAYLRMGNTTAMSQSGGTWGITKTGDGEYNLGTTSNTFAGTVTVTNGTLSFEASVPSGAISPLGNSTSAIVLSGTTLKYRGTGSHSLTRAVSLSGSPSFDASGTGAVTFSPAITHAAGARTITFKGSSTNDNNFTTALTNNGADVVSVTKTEAGKWILSGAPSYTGDTTVSDGTLTFNGQTVQQSVVMNGTGVLDNTILAGVKNITCNGGTPEIKAATAGNTVSGATSITSGSLRVTTEIRDGGKPVKVLGDTDVTVTATLQTTKGTLQRGQMRYGGDLTFSAGSTLRIG